ncbi:PAS domain S-box protein [Rhodoferax sp.]|uniref:sensor histidine kinase n=1 Tax=Rhodoferax sp. TaxID=50421 RepID=UPI00283B97B0|nr:PAS domain S-box protein [Rhodoferax sp.]MDR3370337.1 PAS domain S-box protein [Rhodoferax sp.]
MLCAVAGLVSAQTLLAPMPKASTTVTGNKDSSYSFRDSSGQLQLQAGQDDDRLIQRGAANGWLASRMDAARAVPYRRFIEFTVLIILFLVIVLMLWNLMLRQRVRAKTRSLSESLAALEKTRQDLEQALAEQRAMLNNELMGVVKVQDRKIAWASPAFEAMYGYCPGELVGKPTQPYFPSEEAYLKFAEKAYPTLMSGQVYRTQTEFLTRDGRHIWVELSGSMLATPADAMLWTVLDVTQKRQADAARDEALSRLQKLANSVPGMVYQFVLRPDGSSCLPFASEAMRDIYRVSPKDVQTDASAMFAMHHPDDRQQIMASIRKSATHLTPWQLEYRIRLSDGSERWLFGNSLPERQDDGSVLWHGFITDITERKAADDRLRQLSRSVEQAPVSIMITDLQGDILYVNPTFTHQTGYTLAEAQRQNPRILQSGLTPPEVYVELWDALCQGRVWQGELHNRRKNGELFVEQAVIAPVLDASGKTSHYVAVKKDITRRKQADLALQTSLKEKVALLHEVHHRVKNNLQVITSLLRLEAGRSDQPETRAVLKDMQGRIFAMALLHESLYRTGIFASVELGSYLKQLATQAFRSQTGLYGEVRLVLDVSEVQVAMDQAAPCGLLVNELVSNSLKHGFPAGRSGELVVSSQPSSQAGWWCLTVRDNGVGLPDDFEARRAQSLGLQLVSDLARQLDGKLDIGPGPGAVFSVTFCLQVFPPTD